MATCTNCGRNSRDPDNPISVREVVVITGPTSLAGLTPKYSGNTTMRLQCWCGWHIDGKIEYQPECLICDRQLDVVYDQQAAHYTVSRHFETEHPGVLFTPRNATWKPTQFIGDPSTAFFPEPK